MCIAYTAQISRPALCDCDNVLPAFATPAPASEDDCPAKQLVVAPMRQRARLVYVNSNKFKFVGCYPVEVQGQHGLIVG